MSWLLSLGDVSSAFRCRRFLLLVVLVASVAAARASADEPAAQKPAAVERLGLTVQRDWLLLNCQKLRTAGNLREAADAADKAVALERKLSADDPNELADCLTSAVVLHEQLEEYAIARSLREEILALKTKQLGKDNWQVTDARLSLAEVDIWAKLAAQDRKALEHCKQIMDKVRNLKSKGDYKAALPLAKESLETRLRILGPKDRSTAFAYSWAGSVYHALGRYAEAETMFRNALQIEEVALGKTHPEYALNVGNLANIRQATGDYAGAETLYRQAVEIIKQARGEKNTSYALALSNLATLYLNMGDYARAEPLFRQVLEIRRETLGEKHPDYAQTVNNLARLNCARGDYVQAEPLFREALEIRKRALGEKHPGYAIGLNNLATMYRYMGEYDRSEPLYRQALEIRKQTLGETHPAYGLSLNNLAILLTAMNRPQEAVELAAKAVDIIHGQLDATADVQSEREQLAMNQSFRWYLDTFLTATAEANSPGDEVYPAVLAWKGAVTARQQAVRRMRQAGQGQLDPQTAELYQQLAIASRSLANHSQAVPKPEELQEYRSRLEQLHNQVESLQKKLAAASASYRREFEQQKRTTDDVRRALPAEVALVDLLEYGRYVSKKKQGHKETREPCLAAFVVRHEGAVERIELGPVAPIQQAITVWRWRNIGHPSLSADERKSVEATLAAWKQERQDAEPSEKLRQWVWNKLQPHLNGVKTVLLSPDGATSQFAWPALPGKEPGSYLIEDVALAIVPVPRLLPELLAARNPSGEASQKPAAESPAGSTPTLLLVGDVNFDADPGKPPAESVAISTPPRTRDGKPQHWPALPGTRTEMATIADSFEQAFPDARLAKLRGDKATKGAVVAALTNHRYVHLATHGFFAPQAGTSGAAESSSRSFAADGRELPARKDVAEIDPELLSGLVLAGANQPPSEGRDDGVLTALEVSQLDLTRVDLATLSACETGLGDTAGGEGVLGLQRAFQVAGAKTVVATLWTIDDDASRSLMVDFYENLWTKKLPKLEALRQAQLTMLRDGIKRGLKLDDDQPPDKNRRLPPYYWAAFVLSGDWR